MHNNLEFLDITNIKNNLKEENKFLTPIELDELVLSYFHRGIKFKDFLITVETVKAFSLAAGRQIYNHFFICPICSRRLKKIYFSRGQLGCKECLGVSTRLRGRSTNNKVLRLQYNINELYTNRKSLSRKAKRKLVDKITTDYKSLNEAYKLIYNKVAFTKLQNWCLDNSLDKTKSDEYRKAIKDVLKLLREIRPVLERTGLNKK